MNITLLKQLDNIEKKTKFQVQHLKKRIKHVKNKIKSSLKFLFRSKV